MKTPESMDQTAIGRSPACHAAAEDGIDVDQLENIQTLTPAERLKRHDAALALVLAARQACIQHYGFDPRSPEAS
jgi:hypothetical protein